ncbi:MAG: glycosyltransferase [Gemmatimonas sp.]
MTAIREESVGGSSPTPAVSVLLLTYNHEPFIAQAIESVMSQQASFAYEVIVAEDCSTDRTREIIRELQRQYPRRIRLRFPDANLGATRNALQAIAACRGAYVALLEGDDYWTDPQKLQLQFELLRDNPRAFTCGARAWVWREGQVAPDTMTPIDDSSVLAGYGARELLYGKWWFRTCTKMFPTVHLRAIPPRFLRDWAGTLWLIAHTDFGDVAFLDRVVGVYREHKRGTWSAMDRNHKLAQDVDTLYRTIPLFRGSDRAFLAEQMQQNVEEILRSGPPRQLALTAALRAVRRAAASRHAWRHLVDSLRVHPRDS